MTAARKADEFFKNALAEGLGVKATSLDEALSLPSVVTSPGDWTPTRPTSTGAIVIYAGKKQVATVHAVDCGTTEAANNAKVICRAAPMRVLLERIETDLRSDDDGSRHGEILKAIAEELRRSS